MFRVRRVYVARGYNDWYIWLAVAHGGNDTTLSGQIISERGELRLFDTEYNRAIAIVIFYGALVADSLSAIRNNVFRWSRTFYRAGGAGVQ